MHELCRLGAWLLDSLNDRFPDALEAYAFQFSVLLPKFRRKTRSITSWCAWLPQPADPPRAHPFARRSDESNHIACMETAVDAGLPTTWLLAPEFYWGALGRLLGWESTDTSPRAINEAIAAMDRRTWQALTTGYVRLPQAHTCWPVVPATSAHLARRVEHPTLSLCGTFAHSIHMSGNVADIRCARGKVCGVPTKFCP